MKNFYKSQLLLILLSWFITVAFIALGGAVLTTTFKFFLGIFMWIPGLLALFFSKKDGVSVPILRGGVSKLPFVVALALLTVTLATLFSLPFCQVRSIHALRMQLPLFLKNLSALNTYLSFIFLWLVSGIVLSLFLYMVGLLGQELMFRGYAWEKLKGLGFWKASWILGLMTGVWMAPLMFIGMEYPGSHVLAISLKVVYSILLSPILVYIRIMTRGIVASAFFFGLVHHLSNLFPFLFESRQHFYLGMQGLTGLFSLVFVNLILFLKIRKTPLLEYEL